MKQTTALAQTSIISRTIQSVASRLSMISGKPKDEIEFQSNGVLTLGVEIELQLIDKETFNLASRAEELLASCSHIKKLKPELFLNVVEISTDKCRNVQEIESDLQQSLLELNKVANNIGILLSTTGTHAFAKYSDNVLYPKERYKELVDHNQWMARRATLYGLHVHIGMESGDDCIRFNNFFMYFLPHLLALSASSPFWQGTDTGLSSCRPTVNEARPTAGLPYHVRNWAEFERLIESLKKCGSIRTLKDLWWDMRPSPGFGTLEIRVCDGCATLSETLAIVAFIHSLAHWFADHGSWLESVNYPPRWVSRENKWRVIRYGLDAELVMNTEGKTRFLREDLQEWLEKLQPYSNKLGYQPYLEELKSVISNGTSSQRQRACYAQTQSLEEVVKHNIYEFNRGRPEWNAEKNKAKTR